MPHARARALASVAGVGASAILAVAPDAARAGSGFGVRTQSVLTLGMSQAGMATGAGGLATMIYNPATLSATRGRSAEIASAVVAPAGQYRGIEAGNVFGGVVTGGDGSGENVPGVLPSAFVAGDIVDGLRAGLAVTPLYGLGSHYAADWSGRYHAIDAELVSFLVQPTLAWEATPWLALGAGAQIQYMHSRSTAAIDFGSIDAALTGGALGGAPGSDDGRLEATLDGFAAGFTVGALVSPAPGARIGVGYRSAITQSLEGDADFALGGPVGAGLSALTGAFASTGARSDIRLPDSLFVGAQQRLGSGVTLYADINWMGWGRIDELVLEFDNPAQEDAVNPLRWDDSIFVALGASWDVDDRLTLRAGAAYDQGPARDGGASVAIPDGNSIYAAAGLSYRVGRAVFIDAALGAVFTEDVEVVARASDPGGTFRGDFRGTYDDGRAYFGALALRFDF